MYVTDAQQSVVQSFLYAPYGEIISEYNTHAMGEAFPKYSFNAKELDEETGFYYYEARYYNPPTFISRDPLMSEKPWLMPYHYCSNNPIGRIDPSGMMDDWYQNTNGKIVYDRNVNENTKLGEGERYIGKTANWFGKTEQDEQYRYHGDENGNITKKDMTINISTHKVKLSQNNVYSINSAIMANVFFISSGLMADDISVVGIADDFLIPIIIGGGIIIAGGISLYYNISKTSSKNEKHGDGGREFEKSEKHIKDLENQLNNAKNNKERNKIRTKIRNIKENAQRKQRGEEHSRGNKR